MYYFYYFMPFYIICSLLHAQVLNQMARSYDFELISGFLMHHQLTLFSLLNCFYVLVLFLLCSVRNCGPAWPPSLPQPIGAMAG